MFEHWLLFCVSVGILALSSDRFVYHTMALAKRWRLGLYAVAVAWVSILTSVPEACVSLLAVWQHHVDLAYANIWGSILTNGTLVLGVAALVAPVRWGRVDAKLLALWLGLLLALDVALRLGLAPLADGFLLLFYLAYLWYSHQDESPREALTQQLSFDGLWLLLHFYLIWLASWWLLQSVTFAASWWQLPEWFVGMVLLSVGTSLPELLISIRAQSQAADDLTLGNVMGSNFFLLALLLPVVMLISGFAELPVWLLACVEANMLLAVVLLLLRQVCTEALPRLAGVGLIGAFFVINAWFWHLGASA